jgi:hypothetical protein
MRLFVLALFALALLTAPALAGRKMQGSALVYVPDMPEWCVAPALVWGTDMVLVQEHDCVTGGTRSDAQRAVIWCADADGNAVRSPTAVSPEAGVVYVCNRTLSTTGAVLP